MGAQIGGSTWLGHGSHARSGGPHIVNFKPKMGGATDISVWNTLVHVVPPCMLFARFGFGRFTLSKWAVLRALVCGTHRCT